MGGHIRVDKDMVNDPRVIALADLYAEYLEPGISERPEEDPKRTLLCNACRNALLGALVTLWAYADTHIHTDNALQLSVTHLAKEIRLPLEVLRKFPCEWLVIDSAGRVILPDYVDKNALNAKEKRRAQGRDRVARFRARRNAESNGSGNALPVTHVTHPRAQARARVPVPETVPVTENPLSPSGGGMNGAHAPPSRRPRPIRDASRQAWDRVLEAAQTGRSSVGDERIDAAVRQMGGYGRIGQSTTEQRGENRQRFRELYEQQLEGEGHA